MNDKFTERLEEFLNSECSDYGISYSYRWNEDLELCEVTINRLDYSTIVKFRYNKTDDDLTIEMHEDSAETVREFDWTVKYFWMLISSEIFK